MSFTIGQAVRYKPGSGTYGYEDLLEQDGRVPAVVVGLTPIRRDTGSSRVRIKFTTGRIAGKTRAVDATSLKNVESQS